MKYLFLWIQGALQSWGDDSRFDFRKTRSFPTKSGIYGMLLASSGDSGPQEELLARMADSPFAVVTFQSNTRLLTDFHMVGNGYNEKDPWESLHIPRKADGTKAVGGGAKRTYREYLQDRCFAVMAGFPDDLAEKFAASLQSPVYDLYLGRKCCVPSGMVFHGLFNTEEQAFQALDEWLKQPEQQGKQPEYVIRTAENGEAEAQLINDVPVRFGQNKLYRDRWIVWAPYPAAKDE